MAQSILDTLSEKIPIVKKDTSEVPASINSFF